MAIWSACLRKDWILCSPRRYHSDSSRCASAVAKGEPAAAAARMSGENRDRSRTGSRRCRAFEAHCRPYVIDGNERDAGITVFARELPERVAMQRLVTLPVRDP